VLTGVVAFNIHSVIIHSAFLILISKNDNLKLTSEHLKKLQKNLNSVSYFIIDKKSMIGHHMLALVDMRLCQAFLKYQNQLFKGRLIILVGDFG